MNGGKNKGKKALLVFLSRDITCNMTTFTCDISQSVLQSNRVHNSYFTLNL